MSVSIRFVLTGSCHPYSGRQVLFSVPLMKNGESPSTVADMKEIIRTCWPSELAPLSTKVREVALKILKNGRLLGDDQTLYDFLTEEEIRDSSLLTASMGKNDDGTVAVTNTVLMHLVFHCPPPLVDPEAPPVLSTAPKHVSEETGCCATM